MATLGSLSPGTSTRHLTYNRQHPHFTYLCVLTVYLLMVERVEGGGGQGKGTLQLYGFSTGGRGGGGWEVVRYRQTCKLAKTEGMFESAKSLSLRLSLA